jgi:hypothetical protein
MRTTRMLMKTRRRRRRKKQDRVQKDRLAPAISIPPGARPLPSIGLSDEFLLLLFHC